MWHFLQVWVDLDPTLGWIDWSIFQGQQLISNDLAQKQPDFHTWTIYYLIMITCVSYENIFNTLLPKYTKIVPL